MDARWLLALVGALFVVGEREVLRADRKLPWQSADDPSNQVVYRGQPEQIHIAYGGEPSLILVTWLTFDDVGASAVEWGEKMANFTRVAANSSRFVDGKIVRYVHRAALDGVRACQRYCKWRGARRRAAFACSLSRRRGKLWHQRAFLVCRRL